MSHLIGSVLRSIEDQLAQANAANKGLGHRKTEGCEKCGLERFLIFCSGDFVVLNYTGV